MSIQVFPCHSGNGEVKVEVYKDLSGFDITTIDETGQKYYVILGRVDAQAIINQLQEYLDETSESTPA